MSYRSIPLALLFALALASCGGGGGGGDTGGGGGGGDTEVEPGPLHTANVTSVSGSEETRLACNKGIGNAQCDLRIYQIMVESFIDGSSATNYNVGYGTSHHKGDLAGIINSLDYIKSTGVNAIWLTPVFQSTPKAGQDVWTSRLDATGYFTSNYFAIDPKFGTEAQFKTLVDEAHARGLYVFMDGVFGHYKDNIVASPNGLTPANGVCVNSDGASYAAGSNTACADYTSPETLAFFKEVITYWTTNYKIDGWRLDQGYQVPLSAWRELKQTMETVSATTTYTDANDASVHPLAYMVSEIWSGEGNIASKAYGSTGNPALTSAFDFPGRYRLVQTLGTEEWGVSSGKTDLPATTLREVFASYAPYPDQAMPNLMLTNHDLVRFGDLLQRGDLGQPTQTVYWDRHKAAFAFMAARSGPLTIYYGDEIGAQVANFSTMVTGECAAIGLCDDHVSRSSGKVSGLSDKETALKTWLAQLLALRSTNPALVVGSRTHIFADSNIYIDRKDAGSNRVLFVLNTKNAPATITLQASTIGSPGTLTDLLGGSPLSASAGAYTIELAPLAAGFYSF